MKMSQKECITTFEVLRVRKQPKHLFGVNYHDIRSDLGNFFIAM